MMLQTGRKRIDDAYNIMMVVVQLVSEPDPRTRKEGLVNLHT